MVTRRAKSVNGFRSMHYKRQQGRCYYCRKGMIYGRHRMRSPADKQKLCTLDHKVPLARGGAHTFENTCAACWLCNHRKGTRTDAEFKEKNYGQM